MKPHEEQELNREEGENLLERLTLLTEEDKLVWTCARYIPLFLFQEDDDPVELAQLSQDYVCKTENGNQIVIASISEVLCLSGKSWPTLGLAITTASGGTIHYSDFPLDSIVQFLDLLLPRLENAEAIAAMFDGWVSPFLYEPPEITEHPVSRLCEQLYQERRHMDFHNAVCHPHSQKSCRLKSPE